MIAIWDQKQAKCCVVKGDCDWKGCPWLLADQGAQPLGLSQSSEFVERALTGVTIYRSGR